MKYLLLFTFLFIYNTINGQDCEELKTGVFTIKDKGLECTIYRTEKKEIIKSKYGIVKFKIKWISNCRYILYKRKPKLKIIYNDLKVDTFNIKSDTLYFDITENNEKEFKVISSDKNSNYKIEYINKKNNNNR